MTDTTPVARLIELLEHFRNVLRADEENASKRLKYCAGPEVAAAHRDIDYARHMGEQIDEALAAARAAPAPELREALEKAAADFVALEIAEGDFAALYRARGDGAEALKAVGAGSAYRNCARQLRDILQSTKGEPNAN